MMFAWFHKWQDNVQPRFTSMVRGFKSIFARLRKCQRGDQNIYIVQASVYVKEVGGLWGRRSGGQEPFIEQGLNFLDSSKL